MDFPMDFRMDFPHVPKDHCDIIVTLRFARSSKDCSLAPFRSLSDSVWSQVKLSTLMCCFPGKGQRHQSSRSSRWVTQTHERHETLGASMFLGVFLYPSIFLLSKRFSDLHPFKIPFAGFSREGSKSTVRLHSEISGGRNDAVN